MKKISLDGKERPKAIFGGPVCGFTKVERYFDADAMKIIEGWLADETMTGASIARFLNDKAPDLDIRRDSIQRHRKGECACPRLL